METCERRVLGLPNDWERVTGWFKKADIPNKSSIEDTPLGNRKNIEIELLKDYRINPNPSFWTNFPKSDLPTKPETGIDVKKFENIYFETKPMMTECQKNRAERAIVNLKYGGSNFQKDPQLPGAYVANAKTTFQYGEIITDNIASWVKNGFAAGPFDQPPHKNFRVNSILATKQNEKVRTILNVSLPQGFSLNDNVDETKLEKVLMTSARSFGYTLVEAGEKAIFCKTDMKDAYKNVPIPTEEYRLQGFSWLGKFFVETRQIFGAKTAVSNFDIVGQTILDLAIIKSGIPRKWAHRQLDDVPVTAPRNTNLCEKFETAYENVCATCGVKLAESCPKFDKAFGCTTYGKVLGIWFNSNNLTWSLPLEKREKIKSRIEKIFLTPKVDLTTMQKLMGSLNDVCLMCPFLNTFKKPLNIILGNLQREPQRKMHLSEQSKKDLQVFYNFLNQEDSWLPIAHRPSLPTLDKLTFVSDAAGCNTNTAKSEQVGCASVGFSPTGKIIFAHQLFWSLEVLKTKKDGFGKSMGSKTTTLEFLGLLLPFLLIPEKLKKKHIVMQVDNISCLYAWENRYAKEDVMASILVRTLHLISAFLESKVYVEHLPRISTWEAALTDRMSRKSSTTKSDEELLQSFRGKTIPETLKQWMENPKEDWDLATILLNEVESNFK